MVDLLSRLIVVDPENRMTSLEALRHPWLNAAPYLDGSSLQKLQFKVMAEDEPEDIFKKTSSQSVNVFLEDKSTLELSKSPVICPSK